MSINPQKLLAHQRIILDSKNKNLRSSSPNNNPNIDQISYYLNKIGDNNIFKKSVDIVSGISLLSLFGAGFAEMNLGVLSKNLSNKISKFANFANKSFQMLNSFKNIITLYPRLDFINAFAHGLDFVLPLFVPMNDFYLARGAPLGLYTGAHSINIINEKEKFHNLNEYLEHLKTAFQKTINNFSLQKSGFLKRYFAHENAMMGISSSVLSLSGVLLWKPLESLMGSLGRSIAAFLRDSGGFFQAFEGMKPGHMLSGRIFFGLSGYSQFIGAVCNLLAETVLKNFKNSLDPLSFAFSNLGRWLLRISNDRGEAGLVSKNKNS